MDKNVFMKMIFAIRDCKAVFLPRNNYSFSIAEKTNKQI